MARKAGQLISRGPRTWIVRISLGRDPDGNPEIPQQSRSRLIPRSAKAIWAENCKNARSGVSLVRRRSVSIKTWTGGSPITFEKSGGIRLLVPRELPRICLPLAPFD
jgi:hypothetical protein